MLLIDNQTNQNIDGQNLQKVCEILSKKDVELVFVNNDAMKEINRAQRGKNYPTDVLSFPLEDVPFAPLGTIVISVEKALEVSLELGHGFDDEVLLLFIHGFLHLSGFDHESDGGEMREEEARLVKKFGLPKSLILRTQESL